MDFLAVNERKREIWNHLRQDLTEEKKEFCFYFSQEYGAGWGFFLSFFFREKTSVCQANEWRLLEDSKQDRLLKN